MAERPPKPYATFELFAHCRGYWCKRVEGRQMSFGAWAWPDREAYEASWRAALEKWHKFEKDLAHGKLDALPADLMTIEAVVDAYLAHQHDRATGRTQEIRIRSFADSRRILTRFRDAVGARTTIGDLEYFDPARPADNAVVRYIDSVKQKYGWFAFNRHIAIVASMFAWAEHPVTGLLGRPFRLKTFFQKRDEVLRRREKAATEEKRGKQRWTADELRAFFTLAPMPLRAMFKLMYFANYGNSDIAGLYQSAIDWTPPKSHALPEGWITISFPRGKTSIERTCVIPKDAADDLKAALDARPKPTDEAHDNRVFLTRFGKPYVREIVHYEPDAPDKIYKVTTVDSLAAEFAKLRGRLSRCAEHGWFTAGRDKGAGYRSDRRGDAGRFVDRPEPMKKCPTCGKKLTPMRRLGAYTFRHTATTYASGAADIDTLSLFEGHAIAGVRRHYVEELAIHKLRPIAEKLLSVLT